MAVGLEPQIAKFHNHLGLALAMGGHAEEAITEYREALRIDPWNAEYRKNLDAALARNATK